MDIIKLGTIGTNFVTDWMIEASEMTEELRLQAVYSRAEETGRAFSGKHGNVPYYTDLEAFLSSDIDAVYIASPNFCHYEHVKAALLYGKHVFVEKPATMNAEDFRELCKLAEERGLILLEAMRPGHDPGILAAKAAMARIGKVRRVSIDFCQYSSRYDKFREGTVLHAFDPSFGNAALMDIGCYAIHTLVMLLGAPEEVESTGVTLRNGFEGQGHLLFRYPGATADITYSKIVESVNPSVISGEDGSILIGKIATVPYVDLVMRGQKPERIFDKQDEVRNFVYEARDFIKCVHGELPIKEFQKTTYETLKIMDEVIKMNDISFGTLPEN